ncbi:hypothetical protein B7Y94_06055 [Candidatus Saccharibacteria bacterium 32-49-12]|nr:MAG: hypothetical protein B7Y94_06055 [Candidatus Saccharibacteria bacterium 32-49-12]
MSKFKNFMARLKKPGLKSTEDSARKKTLEELFYDFNRSKTTIYHMNFVRGLFFGFGTVIGGSLMVALAVWLLSLLVDLPGGIGNFVQYIVDIVRQSSSV